MIEADTKRDSDHDAEYRRQCEYLWSLDEESGPEADIDALIAEVEDRDGARELITDTVAMLSTLGPAAGAVRQIDRISTLQTLLNAAARALAAEELAFADQQISQQRADRVRARDLGLGIPEQIGYARRIAPGSAGRHLGLARAWADRLPQSFALLRDGQVSEAQCQILATKSSHLDELNAAILDAAIAPRLTGWNLKQTEQGVQHLVYAIDPQGFVDRRGNAEKDRAVWMRRAPHCMATVIALLPVAEGVAVYAGLKKAADTAYSDTRSGKQVMADTFVERITGQAQAHLVPVQINLTMTAESLLGNGTTPAWLDDLGPVSAEHARAIVAGDPAGTSGEQPEDHGEQPEDVDLRPDPADRPGNCSPPTGSGDQHQESDPASSDRQTDRERTRARAWIRRILTDPVTGIATNIDSRRRTFDGNARTFLAIRDRTCRQPFCSAPSATSTTSTRPDAADPHPSTTARACANAATTSKTCPVGQPAKARRQVKSSPPPPPDTPTGRCRPASRTTETDYGRGISRVGAVASGSTFMRWSVPRLLPQWRATRFRRRHRHGAVSIRWAAEHRL